MSSVRHAKCDWSGSKTEVIVFIRIFFPGEFREPLASGHVRSKRCEVIDSAEGLKKIFLSFVCQPPQTRMIRVKTTERRVKTTENEKQDRLIAVGVDACVS